MSNSVLARAKGSALIQVQSVGSGCPFRGKGFAHYFSTDEGLVKAVNGVSFDIKKSPSSESLARGCGKSITRYVHYAAFCQSPMARSIRGRFFRHGDRGIVDLAQQDPTGSLMRRIAVTKSP